MFIINYSTVQSVHSYKYNIYVSCRKSNENRVLISFKDSALVGNTIYMYTLVAAVKLKMFCKFKQTGNDDNYYLHKENRNKHLKCFIDSYYL